MSIQHQNQYQITKATSEPMPDDQVLLTLSAHAREGYSSHFVCHSVSLSVCHFSILEKAPFLGLKLTSVYILGDDLSPLNVALF